MLSRIVGLFEDDLDCGRFFGLCADSPPKVPKLVISNRRFDSDTKRTPRTQRSPEKPKSTDTKRSGEMYIRGKNVTNQVSTKTPNIPDLNPIHLCCAAVAEITPNGTLEANKCFLRPSGS
ncbi:hypothetical protein NQ318_009371 [Aromia moschata]|uniref:Uncharacterized protein n=1 Tax=Aromia moschata TaxID=1265417 RepID=A0AAV8XFE7_9CUCU|nr:hypothetical protein NQ318_009371 [Aromia moschata]